MLPCSLPPHLSPQAGRVTYVKFHWKPTCGVRSLETEEEIIQVGAGGERGLRRGSGGAPGGVAQSVRPSLFLFLFRDSGRTWRCFCRVALKW